MKKIVRLIKNIQELEKEIDFEEKNILKRAFKELSKKISENDLKTIEIQEKFILKQEQEFKKLNLERNQSIEKLNEVLKDLFNKMYSNSDSEHWLLFSAISVSSRSKSKILEIGTGDGKTSVILAALFPESEIVTIDLPQDNKEFRHSYGRENIISDFIDKRDQLIGNFQNITFIEINSVKLNSWSDKSFDLIWVDGAHGYPVLPLDLYNACRLVRDKGMVLVDDIFLSLRKADGMYRSTAAIETLKLLKENKLIKDYSLLRKRLSLKHNFKDLNEKFFGVIQF